MAKTDTDKLVEQLGGMTVLDLVELKNKLEDEWGVTAAAPVAGSLASVPARNTGAGRHAGPCEPDFPWPGSAVAPEAARAAVASPTVTIFVRRIPYLRRIGSMAY